MLSKLTKPLLLIGALMVIAGCAGKTGGDNGGSSSTASLTLDQVSSVPLINGQPQTFYMYATNTSNSTMSNITWSVNSQDEGINNSVVNKAKANANTMLHQANNSNAIEIKDASGCENIAPNQSCRIELQVNSSDAASLSAVSNGQELKLLGGAGTVQGNLYTPMTISDEADTLTTTSMPTINYSGGIGSGSFFIINNGIHPVTLDLALLSANLPANATLNTDGCASVLASGTACQVRVIITNPTNSQDQELSFNIDLGGSVIDGSSAPRVLPTQNDSLTVNGTTKPVSIIGYQSLVTTEVDNSFANATTATINNIISNSGSGDLVVNSIEAGGDILSITNNTCLGQTLAQGNTCSYTVSLDVSKITGGSSQNVTINYKDIHSGEVRDVISNVTWTYIAPLPVANPSILMSVESSNLNFNNTTTTLTIQNTGNVALSNITMPTISPANPKVSITNSQSSPCSGELAVGSSCNYTVTYAPQGSSDPEVVTFGNVSASHPDNRGATVSTTFDDTQAINLSSTALSFSPSTVTLSTNWANTTNSEDITITNITQGNLTISSITSSLDSVTTNGCTGSVLQGGPDVSEDSRACELIVTGDYSEAISGVLTVNYSSQGSNHSVVLDVNGSYQAKPVVTPSLDVISNSLLGQNIAMDINSTRSYVVELENKSTATNNGDTTIRIPTSSLKPTDSDGVTYTTNTDGIVSGACTIASNGVTLPANGKCSYNLVINSSATEFASTAINWSIDYNYNVYGDNSTTPSLTGSETDARSFNLEVDMLVANVIASLSSEADINNFNGIEQGITPAPTIGLVLRNMGTKAVSGAFTNNLPTGISGDFASCSNLGINESCSVTLTMSTASAIAESNLDVRTLDYNNSHENVTTDYPSIQYLVLAVPSVLFNYGVINCNKGTGIGEGSTCFNNPNTRGGNATSMQIVMSVTNTGSQVVNGVVFESQLLSTLTTQGYTEVSNGCNASTPLNLNESCSLVYSMPASVNNSTFSQTTNLAMGLFNYTYTLQQNQTGSRLYSGATGSSLSVNVVNPTINVSAITTLRQDESKLFNITLGNIYQASAPSVTLAVESADNTVSAAITTTIPVCGEFANNSLVCNAVIDAESNATIADNYRLKGTIFTDIVNTQLFNITRFDFCLSNPDDCKLIYMTEAAFNGNLGGISGADQKCSTYKPVVLGNKTVKAMLYGESRSALPVQSDWVLSANQYYKNIEGKTIAQTNESAVFRFPVMNGIRSAGVDYAAWSGLYSGWNGDNTANCDGWITGTNAQDATIGSVTSTNGAMLFATYFKCDLNLVLYCVEQ